MIFVVGTGRSGTSLAAGILQRLGVHMGDRFVPANHTNPAGHWEDVEFHDLNEAHLQGRLNQEDFIDALNELAFHRPDCWGAKDPRIADLLPIYMRTFPHALFIECRRNRAECVASMMRSYGWEHSDANAVYGRRTSRCELLSSLPQHQHLQLDFERREAWVDQIAHFVGMEPNPQARAMLRMGPNPEKRQSAYVTVPNGSGTLHKLVHFAVIRILQDPRYTLRHDCPTHSPYVHNLHRCTQDFLDSGEDYWLSMDDDNPPTRNPLDLVQLDLDVVGLPTPVWHDAVRGDRPFYLNAVDWDADAGGYRPHEPCEGLQQVDAIGSGCFMVARRVMMALRDQQPFMRKWNDQGLVTMGGDYAFCKKVRKAGFKVWAHFDYPCMHLNTLEIGKVAQAFGEMFAKGTA